MKNVKAFLVDWFVWSYMVIILYKVVWQQVIREDRYAEFQTSETLWILATAFLLAFTLFFVRGFSLGKRFYKKADTSKENKNNIVSSILLILVLVLTFLSGWIITEVSLKELFSSDGFDQAVHLFSELFSPEFSILGKVILAAIETIYMALMATIFAIPPAFGLSFLAAKNLMHKGINQSFYFIIRTIMNVVRAVEPLIWAIIFSVWVGIGPFAGMLALMIHSIVSLAKLYSEQIEEMEIGPVEAIKATGASNLLVLWYGIVPQMINPFLSYTIYRWDINVRMATIIGMVGGGGIGNMLMQYQGMARWHEVGTVVLVIAVIVGIMDYLSARIREKLNRR